VALGAGVVIGLIWALGCPWLVGISLPPLAAERFGCGLAVGVLAALTAPRGVLGSNGSVRLTVTLGAGAIVGAIVGALACVREIEIPPALALGLASLGAGVAVSLAAGVLAFTIDQRVHPRADAIDAPGVPLRALVAGSCGALAVAAWALASGHVLGQKHEDAALHAVAEARDLVAIAAERLLADESSSLDAIAPQLVENVTGGYLVSVDDANRVRGGVGAGVTTDQVVGIDEGPPPTCRLRRKTAPCAVRRLHENTRLVAAVPAQPIAGGVVLAFLLAGLAMTAAALAVGGLLGVGLAAALGQLRARLQPTLVEYRHALERAQAADRARDQFLQLVSVELRSPLDRIIGTAVGMMADTADPLTGDQKEDVKTVLAASRHLTELIDEVLDVSAIATGQITLRLAPTDIGDLVNEVVKIQRHIVQKKGVEVHLSVDTPSPRARADGRRLRQVLTNIVSNAVKFTDKGSITVTVRKADGAVEVSVKDTGPGIAAEALPKLFREFVQLGSLKQRAHGTGLGLAICKRLVDAHGGEVWAESTIGVGSTFHIQVPIAGPPPELTGDDTPVQAAT
jgi:signal transduction histidine kinase